MRRVTTLCLLAVFTSVDQIIKYFVRRKLVGVAVAPRIDGFVALSYTENTGAAFSLFTGKTAALTVVTGIMLTLCVAVLMSGKLKSRLLCWSLVLVSGGGIGNFVDRIARGYVVDYIELLFARFAVFNFADCLVTVGAFLMLAYIAADTVSDIKKNKSKEQKDLPEKD